VERWGVTPLVGNDLEGVIATIVDAYQSVGARQRAPLT
jgi:hypothetical protein